MFIPVRKPQLGFPCFGSRVEDWSPFVVADHWMAARTIQVVSTYGLVANPRLMRRTRLLPGFYGR